MSAFSQADADKYQFLPKFATEKWMDKDGTELGTLDGLNGIDSGNYQKYKQSVDFSPNVFDVHHVGGLPVYGTSLYNVAMSSLENEVDFLWSPT